ncbi:acyl-CoA thioesterase [Loigolactobacillus coryniformis]|uniref:acyl-CoA thioesterase n=1 Tax=Loigolactobacillus coryniformis TaxID=1610 RepID=UPI002340D52A|nr:acyl-CoA thioesterase [Loigolactobacillus coryniformis]MDC4185766.1 acyl-CoA thioesterase [Loigolactobacillus coryniformis]
MSTKSCQSSLVTHQHRVRYQDLNSHQTLHGGQLLHFVDDQVAESARRFGHHRVVTGSVDRFDFILPLQYGEQFTISSFVSGGTQRSLEVYAYVLNAQHELAAEAFLSLISMVQQPDWPQVRPKSQLEQVVCAGYAQRYAANLAQRQAIAARQALL